MNTKAKKQEIISRPPVVVVLGHVDHGKSSLLEAIKDLKITAKESGGITQHIGAYEITVSQGKGKEKKITFIDTPGHAAFSVMRSRGAKIADIAVLVIDASEGVKPQTKEAIAHIKKAQIPMIIALNKIDLPQADPERVKDQLLKEGVETEDRGGKAPAVNVSAKEKKGIDELLEVILLIAEIENLAADASKTGIGTIIETYLDEKRGPVATLLVEEGYIKVGDIIKTDSATGKIKALEDFQGKILKKALPSTPVIILGLKTIPVVGEKIYVCSDLEQAKKTTEVDKHKKERQIFVIGAGQRALNVILKADVAGSLEAIENVLADIPQSKVVLRIIKEGVGAITKNDVDMAKSAKGIIIGFRVKVSAQILKIGEKNKIRIKTFEIIYDLAQGVRILMEKIIKPEIVSQILGEVKIIAIFKKSKGKQIIGGRIVKGRIERNVKLEIRRDEEKIGEGKLFNLQKNKKNISSAAKGEEVGILYSGEGDIEEGDILIVRKEEKIKGVL